MLLGKVGAGIRPSQDDVARRVSVGLDDCGKRVGQVRLGEAGGKEGEEEKEENVLAEMPCFVTERKACEAEADPMASMAI